jgi:tetratricopeptide (TPR) repeat protein
MRWIPRLGAVCALAASACNTCDRPPPMDQRAVAPLRDTQAADRSLSEGNVDAAIATAEAAAAADPTNALAANVLGRALAEKFAATKDDAVATKAKAAFEQARKADPSFWPALQNLAELEAARGRASESAEYYRQLLAAQPDHPDKARFLKAIDGGSQP